MHNASFATKTRHHNKETTSLKELQARLQFLRSRVNSHSDPAIQELTSRPRTQSSLQRALFGGITTTSTVAWPKKGQSLRGPKNFRG
jgi:hypothetical protein